MKTPLTIKSDGHPVEIKATGVVHDLRLTGMPSAQKRREQATSPTVTLGDLWPTIEKK